MTAKRKKIIVFTAAGIFVLFIGLGAAFFLVLPYWVESRLIPRLSEEAGYGKAICEVRRIGFSGADIASFRIGGPDAPLLSADAIRLDYSLSSLLLRRIDAVSASGVEIFFEPERKESLFSKPGGKAGAGDLPSDPRVERISIRNSVLVLKWRGKTERLPFALDIETLGASHFRFRGEAHPFGSPVGVHGDFRYPAGPVQLEWEARRLSLEKFGALIPGFPVHAASGEVDLSGRAEGTLAPFSLSFLKSSLKFTEGKMNDSGSPFMLDIGYLKGGDLVFSGSSLRVPIPFPLLLERFAGVLKAADGGMEASGDLSLRFDEGSGALPGALTFAVLHPVRFNTEFSLKYLKTGALAYRVRSGPPPSRTHFPGRFRIEAGGTEIEAGAPEFDVSGAGSGEGTAVFRMKARDLRAVSEGADFAAPLLSVSGSAEYGKEIPAGARVSFDAEISDVRGSAGTVKIRLPGISFEGNFKTGEASFGIAGEAKIAKGEVSDAELGFRIGGIGLNLPFAWPLSGDGMKGRVSAAEVSFNGRSLGSLEGDLRQRDRLLSISARHESRLLPGLKLEIDGEIAPFSAEGPVAAVDFAIPPYRSPGKIDVAHLYPAAAGISVEGDLEAAGRIEICGGKRKGFLSAKVAAARIEKNAVFLIEGISGTVSFPEIFTGRSGPKQHLELVKGNWGGIELEGGEIDFEIEPGPKVLVERSLLKWCGGSLEAGGFRLPPASDDLRVVLYGDRLNLARLLEQLGLAKGEGEGTVSGRIPVVFRDRKFRFEDGFLYSSPGAGGTIRVSAAEALTAGAPPDSPAHAQVELASEALKDFRYDWVKIGLAAEGENLLLRMALDGKPARPLPFVYRKELGRFVRVETEAGGSLFQGIRLDVNFRLPLDKILSYRSLFE